MGRFLRNAPFPFCGPKIGSQVESRMGAGADVDRRPVSHPRSSNRTCRLPASGFPTGFVADSRAGLTERTSEPEHTQFTKDPLHRKRTSALRLHLVTPSQ